jgi:hypothetical protein
VLTLPFFFVFVFFFVKISFFFSQLQWLQALVKIGFSLDSPAFYTVCEVKLIF